ncbi:MAG: ribbon-helix-helix domain-containing protein [Cyanobacteriota bacterium]
MVQRSPRRVSVTIPHALYAELLERSDLEGRSVSNLAAFLLEFGLQRLSQPPSAPPVFAAPRTAAR